MLVICCWSKEYKIIDGCRSWTKCILVTISKLYNSSSVKNWKNWSSSGRYQVTLMMLHCNKYSSKTMNGNKLHGTTNNKKSKQTNQAHSCNINHSKAQKSATK